MRLLDQSMNASMSQSLKKPLQQSLTPSQARQSNLASKTAYDKFENFMIGQDVSLSVLFNVIDTNSDKKLNRSEFKQKARALHLEL